MLKACSVRISFLFGHFQQALNLGQGLASRTLMGPLLLNLTGRIGVVLVIRVFAWQNVPDTEGGRGSLLFMDASILLVRVVRQVKPSL